MATFTALANFIPTTLNMQKQLGLGNVLAILLLLLQYSFFSCYTQSQMEATNCGALLQLVMQFIQCCKREWSGSCDQCHSRVDQADQFKLGHCSCPPIPFTKLASSSGSLIVSTHKKRSGSLQLGMSRHTLLFINSSLILLHTYCSFVSKLLFLGSDQRLNKEHTIYRYTYCPHIHN